jgi:hypothetical protein
MALLAVRAEVRCVAERAFDGVFQRQRPHLQ